MNAAIPSKQATLRGPISFPSIDKDRDLVERSKEVSIGKVKQNLVVVKADVLQ